MKPSRYSQKAEDRFGSFVKNRAAGDMALNSITPACRFATMEKVGFTVLPVTGCSASGFGSTAR